MQLSFLPSIYLLKCQRLHFRDRKSNLAVYHEIQFVDFNKEMDNKRNLKKNSNVLQQNIAKEVAKDSDSPESFIDEHYFNQILQTDNNIYKEMKPEPRTTNAAREHEHCFMNEIDAQYFSTVNLITTTNKENIASTEEKEACGDSRKHPTDRSAMSIFSSRVCCKRCGLIDEVAGERQTSFAQVQPKAKHMLPAHRTCL